jgi:site-specific recombinase XerD
VEELIELVEDGSELTRQELRYHDKTKVRDEALLILFLGTGIRVSELVGLDLQDINFRENAIRVHRKGDYDAIVYFGDEVSRALKSYLEERKMIIPKSGSENAFFLSLQKSRITVRAVEKLVQKYASRVTSLKKITPHKLRSTYGTNLYKASGDIYLVADVLGHKDVNTTRKHYAAMDEDRRKSAVNMVRLHGGPLADAEDPE